MATDYHGASVYFLFDPQRKTWSQPACERLGIPLEMLPDALPCTQVVGEVTPEAARQPACSRHAGRDLRRRRGRGAIRDPAPTAWARRT